MKTMAVEELQVLKEKNPLLAIDAIVQRHNADPGSAIPILQDIQNTFGYVAPEVLQRVSELSGILESELYSIVTFYSQFRMEPIGENLIQVCHGTACHLAGAERVSEAIMHETGAKDGGTSPDGKFTLEKVACLGCCSLAPVITVNEETYGRVAPNEVGKVLKEINGQTEDKKAGCKGGCHHE
ncbi:NADH-quinone oxidoreductase subunit NuoE [Dethiobacter alkaliphilus]|uniref:NADH dehydrogenase (Ubiquinone) 24 kDa subunit n=2 Tax=Dethiobacter TaxID=427925 RepID=C0GH38_DETAL|nr:NADH-quinone oxidoreductase subunit NuoE [Dethiobacter alkaliphilus]EEG77340.1 NADH dehydrogenase (ubiquinone) 24 kDa subunit [Dethiobacter alkaliphilus AHT 1]MCW3490112.1 NADH-quinone oxidoreductase subunit NuoE [Dethiobacter alkaliphilus]